MGEAFVLVLCSEDEVPVSYAARVWSGLMGAGFTVLALLTEGSRWRTAASLQEETSVPPLVALREGAGGGAWSLQGGPGDQPPP